MVDAEPYVTPREIAEHLGYSLDTIYDWVQTGKIPVAFRAGGRIRFKLSQVEAALAAPEKATR